MKTNVLIQLLSVLLVVVSTSCQPSKNKTDQTDTAHEMDSTGHEQMAKVQYTCTMHPEVVQDQPGKCPKCGMELVKKEHDHMDSDSTDHDHQH